MKELLDDALGPRADDPDHQVQLPNVSSIDRWSLDHDGTWVLDLTTTMAELRQHNADDEEVLGALDRLQRGSETELVGFYILKLAGAPGPRCEAEQRS